MNEWRTYTAWSTRTAKVRSAIRSSTGISRSPHRRGRNPGSRNLSGCGLEIVRHKNRLRLFLRRKRCRTSALVGNEQQLHLSDFLPSTAESETPLRDPDAF